VQLFWRAVGSTILRPMEEKNETLLDGGTLTELIFMILYADIIINTYFLFVVACFYLPHEPHPAPGKARASIPPENTFVLYRTPTNG